MNVHTRAYRVVFTGAGTVDIMVYAGSYGLVIDMMESGVSHTALHRKALDRYP